MQEKDVVQILKKDLKFEDHSINKIKSFVKKLIKANQNHNFISKNTENDIWHRHVLDSAQLIKYIDFKKGSLADFGSGGGFPGIVLSIFAESPDFHVKLYEKSPVKRKFLENVIKDLDIRAIVLKNVYDGEIQSNVVVSRAFKKLVKVVQVSREIVKKPHKLILLKGKNAEQEINKAFKSQKYPYKIVTSMTNKQSKIIIIQFN